MNLKIGFAEIPYINKGLLVYLVFSMGMGVNIPWEGGSIYPWYIDPPTLYNYLLLMRTTHDYSDLVNE
jgi:hypothetical protein